MFRPDSNIKDLAVDVLMNLEKALACCRPAGPSDRARFYIIGDYVYIRDPVKSYFIENRKKKSWLAEKRCERGLFTVIGDQNVWL